MTQQIIVKDYEKDSILNEFDIVVESERQLFDAMPLIAQVLVLSHNKKDNFRTFGKKGVCVFLTDNIID